MEAFKAAAEAVKEKSLPVEDRIAKWLRKWMKVGVRRRLVAWHFAALPSGCAGD